MFLANPGATKTSDAGYVGGRLAFPRQLGALHIKSHRHAGIVVRGPEGFPSCLTGGVAERSDAGVVTIETFGLTDHPGATRHPSFQKGGERFASTPTGVAMPQTDLSRKSLSLAGPFNGVLQFG